MWTKTRCPGRRWAVVILLTMAGYCALGTIAAAQAYLDDFESADSGWLIYQDVSSGYAYTGGEYAMQMKRANMLRWSWTPVRALPESFTIAVTGRALSGDGGTYGLVWGRDDANLTTLQISPEGWYAVYPYRFGRWGTALVEPTRHAAIAEGGAENRLAVAIDGDQIRILVNGATLRTLSDGLGAPLKVGVVTSAGSTSTFSAAFDDFEVIDTSVSSGTGLILYDTFCDASTGWYSDDAQASGSGYRDIEYALWTDEPNHVQWAWAPLSDPLGEATADTQAYVYRGDETVRYGIVWGLDNRNFYLFEVTSRGEYVVDLQRDGVWQERPVPWGTSAAIRGAGFYDKLRLELTGRRATVSVNGVELADFPLSMPGPYWLGVAASSDVAAPVEVRFVDFVIRE
jgi:hypothetical protein